MTTSRNLCMIPARGGSKRIPHKNIHDFLGKPLIAYSIDAALQSGIFEHVIVSTDDEEIAACSKKCGAEVPYLRDHKLADDFTGTFAVTEDAWRHACSAGFKPDCVCCLYATAPLLTAARLKKAWDFYQEQHADYVYGCCEFPFPIQRSQFLDDNFSPTPVMPEYMNARSQDLRPAYQDAGQFYFYSPGCFEHHSTNFPGSVKRGFILPRHLVVDIDTPEDLLCAMAMAKALKELHLD